jgi:hypothetical protein
VLVTLIGLVAAFLRCQAAVRLPVDKDERVYLSAAFRYRDMMSQGTWNEIPRFHENMEHPPFVKLVYATDLMLWNTKEPQWDSVRVGQPIPPDDRAAFYGPRVISAAGSTLQVFVVALVHPIAGLVLAFDTYHIKYGAEAYLEGVPGLMMVLAVFLVEIGRPRTSRSVSFVPSAIALGLAAAGKYIYGIAGIVIVPFVLYRTRSLRPALLYCVIALSVFVMADPFIWSNPYSRLLESLTSHWRIAHGGRVASLAMPWYSPIVHLVRSEPMQWHDGVFYTRLADVLILPLSLIGLRRARHERPIWVAWAGVGLLFLLIWPAKMQQYILLVLPPLAVCAGIGIEQLGRIASGKAVLSYHPGGGDSG